MKPVTVYTTQTCPHCRTAKEFLKQQNIHFIEKDVNTDAQARSEMMRRKVNGVPFFTIGEDLIVGFDRARIMVLVDHRLVECPSCRTRMRVPTDKGTIRVTCPNCSQVFQTNPK